ncbi:signal peptidase I [Rugamonas sp.]|uniref:signal peptidase I n=1 Tax=Rugamonas sp. TaxID=1926287 RepID=UPI0026013121|nr:signal peptidase I [Rugamonas sp.]
MSEATFPESWKPKTWIAVILSLFSAPLALLYLERVRWAAWFFLWVVVMGGLGFTLPSIFNSTFLSVVLQLLTWFAGVIVCYREVSNSIVKAQRRWYSRWQALTGLVVAVLLSVTIGTTFLYEHFRVPSTSMLPTVGVGSNVIVQKWGYGHYSKMGVKISSRSMSASLQRGDIVVFDYPVDVRQMYIKRLVGLPGDLVEYRDKHLYVNGHDTRGSLLAEYLEQVDDGARYLTHVAERLESVEYEVLMNPDRDRYFDPRDFPFHDTCQFNANSVSCRVPENHFFVLGDNRDNSTDSRDWGYVRSDQIVGKVVKIFR